MTGGRFIAVVGPSGVGKDSVMQAMAARDPQLVLARRVISRPSEAGGEDFDGVTPERFATRAAAGHFALHWGAHGLHYGIPATVDSALATGRDVLANLSRGVLDQADARFARLAVLNLTASPEALAARLHNRGRETGADIARRLSRPTPALPAGITVHELANDGALDDTVTRALALLYPVNA